MMEKLLHFDGRDQRTGQVFTQVVRPGRGMSKMASVDQLHPDVQYFISHLDAQKGHTYVLNNALGSWEGWGSNINGDAFPEAGLLNGHSSLTALAVDDVEGRTALAKRLPFGYPTFYKANIFQHHCFPAGTPVRVGPGMERPIDEIREGDFVSTRFGLCEVERVYKKAYEGRGRRLRLRGVEDPLVATEDHPVLVYRRGRLHCRHNYLRTSDTKHWDFCKEIREPVGEPEWVPLSEVREGDYFVQPVPKLGEHPLVPDEFLRLVGWTAAEGYLSKDGYLVQFTFGEGSVEDIADVRRCAEALGHHVSETPRPQHGTVMLSISSKELHKQLSAYVQGVLSEKTLTERVFEWDRESVLKMLGAYIDGDGHVYSSGKNEGQLRIRSSSPTMRRILSDLIRATGAPCVINKDVPAGEMISPTNGERYSHQGSGCVSVAAVYSAEVAKYSRKRHQRPIKTKQRVPADVGGNNFLIRVDEIEEIWLQEDVYNLEIKGYHEYMVHGLVVHNCNKDPSKTLGQIILVVWNPRMKRVEVLFDLDHERCRQQDAWGLIERINAGDFPASSMGCRVPNDRCSICGHLARTQADYCEHVNNRDPRFGMNRILADGQICCVHNDKPDFFDDSFVTIGADKTSFLLAKVAHAGQKYWVFSDTGLYLPSAARGEAYYNAGTEKTAAIYTTQDIARRHDAGEFSHISIDSDQRVRDQVSQGIEATRSKEAVRKLGEMLKSLPPGPTRVMDRVTAAEPELPRGVLTNLSRMPSLQGALHTPTRLGMVLKPAEFQRIMLERNGMSELADDYDRSRVVFAARPPCHGGFVPKMEPSAAPVGLIFDVMRSLLDMLQERSCAAPVFKRRLILAMVRPTPPTAPRVVDASDPVLNKVAEAYSYYRGSVLRSVGEMNASLETPLVKTAVMREDVLDVKAGIKEGSVSDTTAALALLSAIGPLVYLNSAYLKDRELSGEELGLIQRALSEHPGAVTALTVGPAAVALKNPATVAAAAKALA